MEKGVVMEKLKNRCLRVLRDKRFEGTFTWEESYSLEGVRFRIYLQEKFVDEIVTVSRMFTQYQLLQFKLDSVIDQVILDMLQKLEEKKDEMVGGL